MYTCPKCNKEIDELTFYPHITIIKKSIDISSIPIEILEDLPRAHLHCFYECKDCKIKYEIYEMKLLSDKEVDISINNGYPVKERNTIRFWKDWLNKQGK